MRTIVDEENAETHDGPPLVGERVRVIGRFSTQAEAILWLDSCSVDSAKVERGGYGLDGPLDDSGPTFQRKICADMGGS